MRTGLERVRAEPGLLDGLGRVGLVTNQAATTRDFAASAEVVDAACSRARGSTLACVFGPQHGYWQTEQDNMIETPDLTLRLPSGKDLPLLSLYSETRVPTPEQLAGIDTLVVDLIDVGCRVYTYMLTLAGCLRAASPLGKRVVVLDRPNPLGLSSKGADGRHARVEGNTLDLRWESFVGWYTIPMRHGLSMGELGNLFLARDRLGVDYRVIACDGLARDESAESLRANAWTLPSPNLPTWDCAFLFPSFVSLEGTNVSEGRGTTLPFQIVGAPWFDADGVRADLECVRGLVAGEPCARFDAVRMRRQDFRPVFNKHAKEWCRGLQFHPMTSDEPSHNAFALGIWFLAAVSARHPNAFGWKAPGYEYNFTDPPLNLIHGDARWLAYFDSVRGKPASDWHGRTLELLRWADASAQAFAEEASFAHIYRPTKTP